MSYAARALLFGITIIGPTPVFAADPPPAPPHALSASKPAGIMPGFATGSTALDCPPEAIPESEPRCADNYVDRTNGGCAAATPAWTTLALNGLYCGTSGGYLVDDAPCISHADCDNSSCFGGVCTGPVLRSDFDWWTLDNDTGSDQLYRISVTTDFQALVGFLDDDGHTCAAQEFIGLNQGGAGVIPPLQSTEFMACLGPGSWSVVVVPLDPANTACGSSSTYMLEFGLGDAGMGPGVCRPEFPPCPLEDRQSCQLPDQVAHGADHVVAANSDAHSGYVVADNFKPLSETTVGAVCWWGIYVNFYDGSSDCGPGITPDDFTLRYYLDDNGVPGDMVAEFSQSDLLTFDRWLTGRQLLHIDEYVYSATHPPVVIDAGQCLWLSIVGTGDASGRVDCNWLWSATRPGDGRSYQSGAGNPIRDYDLAWCVDTSVEPNGCDQAGACCDATAGACEDEVPIAQCSARYVDATACADLAPLCGTGACCTPPGVCTDDVAAADCTGRFSADTLCADAPACGTGCTVFEQCADTDGDAIRDDGCVWWSCDDGTCTATDTIFADMVGPFGACEPDGATDGNDRFAARNCFANTGPDGVPPFPCEDPRPSAPPVAFNVDAGGPFGACAPDGFCDGNDVFHALNAFSNATTCACPLDGPRPAPAPSVGRRSRVGLQLRGPRVGLAGTLVSIDVHANTQIPDLRGYQLHLGASGGASGGLDLVDMAAPFAERPAWWTAFNRSTGQLLAGTDGPAESIDRGTHLATYVYRIAPGSAGTFVIDLLHDAGDPHQRTFLFPEAPTGRIDVAPTASTRITIEPRLEAAPIRNPR